MKKFDFILSFIPEFPSFFPKKSTLDNNKITKNLLMRNGEGSVLLSLGKIKTKKDIDKMYNSL